MRQFILILTLGIFFLSCGQNENKQKELELKERELALKEKEFALKQKDSSNIQNQAKPVTTTPATDNSTITASHSDFKVFLEDFKKAILSDDKESVFQMTKIPFLDNNNDGYYNAYHEESFRLKSATSKTKEEFLKNYTKIFTKEFIENIKKNNYRGWQKSIDDFGEPDYLKKGEYEVDGRIFSKISGNYKLAYITYKP